MQVDVFRDGLLWKYGQSTANPALWAAIRSAAGNGRTLVIRPHVPVPPTPPPPSSRPYGTAADAGRFAGRGMMLGANPDVWDQALSLRKAGGLDLVAVVPATPAAQREKFALAGLAIVTWCPPEQNAATEIVQAENQAQWNSSSKVAPGVVLNSWLYGPMGKRCALVEAYYNEGWGVDFGVFPKYMAQGAQAVIPVCGGYSAQGRSDAESARLYRSLADLPFPGFWMYAGESPLTSESAAVLSGWRPH